ncbi:MAG: hypothetical protein WD076_09965 [Parvularculaceae bacterium]
MRVLTALLMSATMITATAQSEELSAMVEAANASLLASGHNYQIGMVQWINDGETELLGQTLLFKDVGNKQLDFDYLPGDPNKGGRTNITYVMDGVELTADATNEFAAIDSAMQTWQDVSCSNIPITDRGDTMTDEGFVQAAFGFGGNPNIIAPIVNGWDVGHYGFLPAAFFDLLAPGGGGGILGVTFTIIYTDAMGNPVDTDNNGAFDAAYREIYYNDGFNWVDLPTDGPGNGLIDLESVALHEAGHGLSQGHFGNAAIINSNGKIRISPNAVMNAGYIFAKQDLQGSDTGGHCSNWTNWPTN